MGKLHDRMREDLLLKAYSPHTQKSYLRCARHFASHYMRSPQEMGEKEIRGFLLHLVRDRKASPATQDGFSLGQIGPKAIVGLCWPRLPHTLKLWGYGDLV